MKRYGRNDRIRTCGLTVPNRALYQAELHSGDTRYYNTRLRVSSNAGNGRAVPACFPIAISSATPSLLYKRVRHRNLGGDIADGAAKRALLFLQAADCAGVDRQVWAILVHGAASLR